MDNKEKKPPQDKAYLVDVPGGTIKQPELLGDDPTRKIGHQDKMVDFPVGMVMPKLGLTSNNKLVMPRTHVYSTDILAHKEHQLMKKPPTKAAQKWHPSSGHAKHWMVDPTSKYPRIKLYAINPFEVSMMLPWEIVSCDGELASHHLFPNGCLCNKCMRHVAKSSSSRRTKIPKTEKSLESSCSLKPSAEPKPVLEAPPKKPVKKVSFKLDEDNFKNSKMPVPTKDFALRMYLKEKRWKVDSKTKFPGVTLNTVKKEKVSSMKRPVKTPAKVPLIKKERKTPPLKDTVVETVKRPRGRPRKTPATTKMPPLKKKSISDCKKLTTNNMNKDKLLRHVYFATK